MVRLKSRTQCPVGGFQFVQAETGAKFETWDFNQMVQAIQAHRQLNPRFKLTTNPDAIANEVDVANALRMLAIKGAESYITENGGPAANFPGARTQNWRSVAGSVKRVSAGVGTLTDWLGAGGVPVPVEQARSRAAVCAACPQNKAGDWLSKFTQPVALKIQSQLNIRNDLAMATPDDEKLNFCEACSCPLKLKVHTPLEHIAAHQSDEVKSRLDAGCWILKEMTA